MKTQIPFKSVLTKFKNIDNRNKKFNSLTKEQQRKEIAYDCLSLLLTGKVKGAEGNYWSNILSNVKAGDAKQFQYKLINKLPKCEVCVRGGMMLSQIRLGNDIDCNEENRMTGDDDIIKGFDYTDFEKMEEEYEYSNYYQPYPSKSTKKLANICCNVIKNGNFKTTDRTDYLVKWNIQIK